MQLSILIPTYKQACFSLVEQVHSQAMGIAGLQFEILVADDGTPKDHPSHQDNRQINALEHCQLIVHSENVGRSANRNFLAEKSQYPFLLFIDSHMKVDNDRLLANYIAHLDEKTVVYGGYDIPTPLSREQRHFLRARYEDHCRKQLITEQRQKQPYQNLHTGNILIPKAVMQRLPFDQSFRDYGYEDVIYGKNLQEYNIAILHIDNPVFFSSFESNAAFMEKTRQAILTLVKHRNKLEGYSTLVSYYNKLEKWHLVPLLRLMYKAIRRPLHRNLLSNHPSVTGFQIYKLGLFATTLKQLQETSK